MTIADVPFEQRMKYDGAEYRRSVVAGLQVFPDNLLFKETLRDIDEWFRAQGVDPETIQPTPEQVMHLKNICNRKSIEKYNQKYARK